MNFKQFLIEYAKPVANESDIIYQKILDNLDHGHVDFTPEKVSLNVATIIKNSKYNNLHLVVRHGRGHTVRLGKDKDNKSVIVIDVTGKLPTRKNLIRFFELPRYADKIKLQLKRYFELHHNMDSPNGNPEEKGSKYEQVKDANKNFEQHYEKFIKAIEQKILKYYEAKNDLHDRQKRTGNTGKQEILNAATKHLFSTEIGGSFDEFKGIVMKLPEAAFTKYLEPEYKKKFTARLESFYEHKAQEFNEKDEK